MREWAFNSLKILFLFQFLEHVIFLNFKNPNKNGAKIDNFSPNPGTKLAHKKTWFTNYRNLFLANAFPEPDLRYFSNS